MTENTTTATTTPEALVEHYAEQAAQTLNARLDLEAEIDRAIATTKGGPCR